jgi:hypothetical protein
METATKRLRLNRREDEERTKWIGLETRCIERAGEDHHQPGADHHIPHPLWQTN